MSVRVNLLPEATRQRGRAARARVGAGVVMLGLVGALGAGYWWQLGRVDDARQDRDLASAEVSRLDGEVAELAAFDDLKQRVDQADGALLQALGSEISFAGVLQDVAAVTPTDTALTSLELTVMDETGPDGQRLRPVTARLLGSGESLDGHAPGLEDVLRQFDKVGAFFNVYFTNAVADEDDPDVSVFDFEVDLGIEGYTGRYLLGVPEELR